MNPNQNNNNYIPTTFTIDTKPIKVLISQPDNEVWMDATALCTLYQKGRSTMFKILKIFKDEKDAIDNGNYGKIGLVQGANYAKIGLVQNEGKRGVIREVIHYNFEAVMQIGNILNSDRWKLLKEEIESNENEEIQGLDENPIIKYNNGSLQLDVRISPREETVWLTQNQIAMLYETTQPNISMHIKNIVEEGELEENFTQSICKNFLPAHKNSLLAHNSQLLAQSNSQKGKQGNQYAQTYYNLDMVLAVGYRVKSKRAIEFRRWVSTVMKQYIIQGYAINQKRIESHNECLLNLIDDVSLLKKEVNTLKEIMFEKPPKENLFYEGQYYNSFSFVNNLILNAKKRVVIIDGYADNKLFDYFINSKKGISKTVYCYKSERISKEALERFQSQYGDISIIEIKSFHDRFLIIDDDGYILGSSLNALGNKTSCVVKLESLKLEELLKE